MSEMHHTTPKHTDEGPLGLYVHVPFCATTCDFCAFYQSAPTAEGVEKFLNGIEREAELLSWDAPVETVFWGGGTPGLLGPNQIRRLGATISRRFGGQPSEWSVEMAPAFVTRARLEALKEIGVTRISMGVQSLQPERLDALGRHHSREQVLKAYALIREIGFVSVNLDLMFALPGQDEEAWRRDLAETIDLGPDHISTYCLTFEEDTRLWLKLSKGEIKRDQELEAALYQATWDRLAEAGYGHYEISNFARPDHACVHNLNTWRMARWIGLGPSAASQYGGWRGTNVSDTDRWAELLGTGQRATEDRVELSTELLLEDALIFGVRLINGVDLRALRVRFPNGPWSLINAEARRLSELGLAEADENRLKLTRRGRLLADSVGAEWLNAFTQPVSL